MRESSHVQYDIEYHIVWTTKYQYKVLSDKIAERCRLLIRQSCNNLDVDIIKGYIFKEYIHIVVSCPPNISVSKLVQKLKRKTSKELLNEYKELNKIYEGQSLWAEGYLCQSVGSITKEIIKEYIENQQDESEKIFKIID